MPNLRWHRRKAKSTESQMHCLQWKWLHCRNNQQHDDGIDRMWGVRWLRLHSATMSFMLGPWLHPTVGNREDQNPGWRLLRPHTEISGQRQLNEKGSRLARWPFGFCDSWRSWDFQSRCWERDFWSTYTIHKSCLWRESERRNIKRDGKYLDKSRNARWSKSSDLGRWNVKSDKVRSNRGPYCHA